MKLDPAIEIYEENSLVKNVFIGWIITPNCNMFFLEEYRLFMCNL